MSGPILDYVKEKLEANRGDWPAIAERTGVPYGTITNIVQGKSRNPRVLTLQPLIDYFSTHDDGKPLEAAA